MTLGQKVDFVEDFILARHKGTEGAALIRFAMMAQRSGDMDARRATVMLTARLAIEKKLVGTATAEVALKLIDVRVDGMHDVQVQAGG